MVKVRHIFKPIYTEDSKILILGSIPSIKSRENGFYYSHPYNRFWKVMSAILKESYPETDADKIDLLNKNHIALWDVLESCDIEGSSDSSIKNPKPNDINKIIKKTKIETIFVTGKKAESLYNKLCFKQVKIPCIYLPSPSPANCAISEEKLKKEYQIILKYL